MLMIVMSFINALIPQVGVCVPVCVCVCLHSCRFTMFFFSSGCKVFVFLLVIS